jgi:predicted dehydrogenase
MTSKSSLQVALVGTGFMGRVHSIAYAILPTFFPDLPPVRRRVVADVTGELARRGAAQFGYEESTASWEEAVTRDDIDIVDVVTPNDMHAPIAEKALAAGKHVICEKPLALTAAEARRLGEMAASAPGVSMTAFNYRRCVAVLEARRIIEGGGIGDVLGFRSSYLQDWAMPEGSPWTWRFSAAQSGSGALGDIGSHALDLALFLVGDIVEVAGATETFVRSRPKAGSGRPMPVDVDDCTVALLRFANGALGTLEASRFAWGRKNHLTFEISGTRGALAFDWERSNELRFYSAADGEAVQGFRTILAGPKQQSGELFWPIPGIGMGFIETQVMQAGALVGAIAAGRRADTDFAHGYRVQAVMERILEAAAARTWLPVGETSDTCSSKRQ